MEWIETKTKLPAEHMSVLVIRRVEIEAINRSILIRDIGYVEGDRWKLNSQQFCPLPCSPMVDADIITHWMPLPPKPRLTNYQQ